MGLGHSVIPLGGLSSAVQAGHKGLSAHLPLPGATGIPQLWHKQQSLARQADEGVSAHGKAGGMKPDTPEPIAAPLAADVAQEGAGAEGDASSSDSDLSSDSESDDEAEAKAEASGPVAGATAEPCTSPSTAALLADEDATRWYFDAGTDGKGE